MEKFKLYLKAVVGCLSMLCGFLIIGFGARYPSQRVLAGALLIVNGLLLYGSTYRWFVGDD